MKTLFNIFTACTLLSMPVFCPADEIAKWSLAHSQKPDEEFLLYRLSYSGFFTAYAWKDIADLVISAENKPTKFNEKKSCRLHLKMSTENFSISELFSPMRYHWRSTVDPKLKQIYMFEEINENEDDIHQVAWINKQSMLEFYHKRKKIAVPSDDDEALADDDYNDDQINSAAAMVWQKDGVKKAPSFLTNKPAAEGGRSYLIHHNTIASKTKEPIFDPLTLIYSARWHEYTGTEEYDYTVSYKDTFRKYQVFLERKEPLDIANKTVKTIKIAIRRDEDEARDDEGYMIIWLSDDENRIPLQYLIEFKLGTIKLKLETAIKDEDQTPVRCTTQ